MPEVTEVKKNEDAGFEVDLNRWVYRDLKAFRKSVREDDEEVFAPLVAKVMVDWPYDLPISTENILSLGVVDLMTVLRAVNIAAERAFRAG